MNVGKSIELVAYLNLYVIDEKIMNSERSWNSTHRPSPFGCIRRILSLS